MRGQPQPPLPRGCTGPEPGGRCSSVAGGAATAPHAAPSARQQLDASREMRGRSQAKGKDDHGPPQPGPLPAGGAVPPGRSVASSTATADSTRQGIIGSSGAPRSRDGGECGVRERPTPPDSSVGKGLGDARGPFPSGAPRPRLSGWPGTWQPLISEGNLALHLLQSSRGIHDPILVCCGNALQNHPALPLEVRAAWLRGRLRSAGRALAGVWGLPRSEHQLPGYASPRRSRGLRLL